MAALFALHLINDRALRRERVFRDRSQDLDALSDSQLIARYRFPREGIIELTELVRNLIERPTARSHAIPPHIQVMTTLRLLAKGDFLSETGDVHGISIASSSRILHSVCSALCERLHNIRWPSTAQERLAISRDFYSIASFPNVIGCVDGTLVPIQGMCSDEEPAYVCRKGFHAINVQGIVDAKLRFTNIVARWPGSTHDAFILSNSNIPAIMENGTEWLLGDSGYPLKRWLLTPLNAPQTEREQRYNRAHCKTRNVVERSFGVLKSRFRCLHKTGGCLQFSPPKNCKIIETCCKLHNKAIDNRVPLPDDQEHVQLMQNDHVVPVDQNGQGWRIRQDIIQRF